MDRTASSLVYVEGVETQGLLNFLLNSKSCTSTTGPLAGVPPTLLSPVAFQGGALVSLKVRDEAGHCLKLQRLPTESALKKVIA